MYLNLIISQLLSVHIIHPRDMHKIKVVRDVQRYFGRDYALDLLFPNFSICKHIILVALDDR